MRRIKRAIRTDGVALEFISSAPRKNKKNAEGKCEKFLDKVHFDIL
jgi:hypothetical protein